MKYNLGWWNGIGKDYLSNGIPQSSLLLGADERSFPNTCSIVNTVSLEENIWWLVLFKLSVLLWWGKQAWLRILQTTRMVLKWRCLTRVLYLAFQNSKVQCANNLLWSLHLRFWKCVCQPTFLIDYHWWGSLTQELKC